jgi:hypothetical protein
MADDESPDRGEGADRAQDPLVDRLRPDPSQPPQPTRTLQGVLGDSDRSGYRRIYFTPELDYYAEFREEDVIAFSDIAADQSPFLGELATRATLRRDATVDFTRSHRARPLDEFDLDVRLSRAAGAPAEPNTFGCGDTEFFGCTQFCTMDAECPGPTGDCPVHTLACETVQITICRGNTCIDVCETRRRTFCDQDTCVTCRTCDQATCHTCQTRCHQATCQTCTCPTACNQATCQTCQTRCNQDTCRTCETKCGTCNPHVFTCGPNCVEP